MANHIPEQKLKAFSIGTMGKRQLSKKELEEQRKREQEKAAAQAFEEFVATFQEAPSKTSKVWVKAGTYDAGKRQEDTKDKGKLYKPTSRLEAERHSSTDKAQEYAKLLSEGRKPERPGKRKEREKKKSNLELFKEELKLIQEEREERHKYKGAVKTSIIDSELGKSGAADDKGSFDSGDPNTTNIYLGNISPKITEQQLMELFGKYGPLASIKIMWPRSDEEKSRGRNCGFVAFMNRKDGDRAMKALSGKDVMGYEMKLGWGKGVPIPPFPIYIPPALLALTQPPPPSGLPFNAQPHPKDKAKVPAMRVNEPYPENPEDQEIVDKILPQALVKVVMPNDRNLLMLIHHMIEYVIREGPMFEAMIMNREINTPMFRFLFDNQSPAHVYYRWKLFSLLQGDSPKEWRTDEFRMFKDGPIWRPPPMNLYTQGMPEELVEREEERKGGLSPAQRDRLEQLVRRMTPGRLRVADAMVFCIEHADAADEICDVILESLSNPSTALYKKVARLYLVSDILHNCGIKVNNASVFRKCLETRLVEIFRQTNLTYNSIESRLKAEALKEEEDEGPDERGRSCHGDESRSPRAEAEVDGDELDGVPLDGAALLKAALGTAGPADDIDGVPLDDDIDGVPIDGADFKSRAPAEAFVPSRWEEVDPELIEAQAMTTSKWELLEAQERARAREEEERTRAPHPGDGPADLGLAAYEANDDSLDSRDVQEEVRRARLREIELKVVQYQDELESGKRPLKPGWTFADQVEHHRKKLLRKAEKSGKDKPDKDKRRSLSPDDSDSIKYKRGKRSRSSSLSPPPSKRSGRTERSRSRSPYKKGRRSRSPPSRRSTPDRDTRDGRGEGRDRRDSRDRRSRRSPGGRRGGGGGGRRSVSPSDRGDRGDRSRSRDRDRDRRRHGASRSPSLSPTPRHPHPHGHSVGRGRRAPSHSPSPPLNKLPAHPAHLKHNPHNTHLKHSDSKRHKHKHRR